MTINAWRSISALSHEAQISEENPGDYYFVNYVAKTSVFVWLFALVAIFLRKTNHQISAFTWNSPRAPPPPPPLILILTKLNANKNEMPKSNMDNFTQVQPSGRPKWKAGSIPSERAEQWGHSEAGSVCFSSASLPEKSKRKNVKSGLIRTVHSTDELGFQKTNMPV